MNEANLADIHAVIDEVHRARALLNCFINGLTDDRADDRYVLWTVEEILENLATGIDRLPSSNVVKS